MIPACRHWGRRAIVRGAHQVVLHEGERVPNGTLCTQGVESSAISVRNSARNRSRKLRNSMRGIPEETPPGASGQFTQEWARGTLAGHGGLAQRMVQPRRDPSSPGLSVSGDRERNTQGRTGGCPGGVWVVVVSPSVAPTGGSAGGRCWTASAMAAAIGTEVRAPPRRAGARNGRLGVARGCHGTPLRTQVRSRTGAGRVPDRTEWEARRPPGRARKGFTGTVPPRAESLRRDLTVPGP